MDHIQVLFGNHYEHIDRILRRDIRGHLVHDLLIRAGLNDLYILAVHFLKLGDRQIISGIGLALVIVQRQKAD